MEAQSPFSMENTQLEHLLPYLDPLILICIEKPSLILISCCFRIIGIKNRDF